MALSTPCKKTSACPFSARWESFFFLSFSRRRETFYIVSFSFFLSLLERVCIGSAKSRRAAASNSRLCVMSAQVTFAGIPHLRYKFAACRLARIYTYILFIFLLSVSVSVYIYMRIFCFLECVSRRGATSAVTTTVYVTPRLFLVEYTHTTPYLLFFFAREIYIYIYIHLHHAHSVCGIYSSLSLGHPLSKTVCPCQLYYTLAVQSIISPERESMGFSNHGFSQADQSLDNRDRHLFAGLLLLLRRVYLLNWQRVYGMRMQQRFFSLSLSAHAGNFSSRYCARALIHRQMREGQPPRRRISLIQLAKLLLNASSRRTMNVKRNREKEGLMLFSLYLIRDAAVREMDDSHSLQ